VTLRRQSRRNALTARVDIRNLIASLKNAVFIHFDHGLKMKPNKVFVILQGYKIKNLSLQVVNDDYY